MKKTEIIRGRIVGCTAVEHYTKRNGEKGQKCFYHIVTDDGRELAVTATGELVNYVGMLDVQVEMEYVCRVFPFERNGMTRYGNDVYAKSIRCL